MIKLESSDFIYLKEIKIYDSENEKSGFNFKDTKNNIEGFINVFDDMEMCQSKFYNNPIRFGSNSQNKTLEKFIFNQIGDVAYNYFNDRIFFKEK